MKTKIQLVLVASMGFLLLGWICGGSGDDPPTGPESPGPIAEFTMAPAEGPCPLMVQFTDQSTNNPTTWSWDFGDQNTSNAPDPSHTYADEGTYSVKLFVQNDANYDDVTKENCITVLPPVPDTVLILPWYNLWYTGVAIEETPDTAETTYVGGETWPNWEPVRGELIINAITISWDTTDAWDNPYQGTMSIQLNDSLTQVTSFSVDATLASDVSGWGIRHIVFNGHGVPEESSSASTMLFRLWGITSCGLIDSLSDITVGIVDDTTYYRKLDTYYCDDSSRVEINITKL